MGFLLFTGNGTCRTWLRKLPRRLWDFRSQSSVTCWLHLPYKTKPNSCGIGITPNYCGQGMFWSHNRDLPSPSSPSRKAGLLENSALLRLTLTKSWGLRQCASCTQSSPPLQCRPSGETQQKAGSYCTKYCQSFTNWQLNELRIMGPNYGIYL